MLTSKPKSTWQPSDAIDIVHVFVCIGTDCDWVGGRVRACCICRGPPGGLDIHMADIHIAELASVISVFSRENLLYKLHQNCSYH